MPYNILVTGAAGQVGSKMIRSINADPDLRVLSYNHHELDITDIGALQRVFSDQIHAVINCAAYTRVDQAQTQPDEALNTNTLAPAALAEACKNQNILLLHFSTDYVYDNGLTRPLKEYDPCNPKSIYAITKYLGEQKALYYHPKTIILRTSWVYAREGQNFVNTISKLAREKSELQVVNDQIGAPTYTPDLVDATLVILKSYLYETTKQNIFGIYNFSNGGAISWYEFSKEIISVQGLNCTVHPVTSQSFPRPAPRPNYSVFDLEKIHKTFGIIPKPWAASLQECLIQEDKKP